jgi:hypothetical protein
MCRVRPENYSQRDEYYDDQFSDAASAETRSPSPPNRNTSRLTTDERDIASSGSYSGGESTDEFRPSRVRSTRRNRRHGNSTPPDAGLWTHRIHDQAGEKSESVRGANGDQTLFNYIMERFNALQTEQLRHHMRLRELTADIERLSSTSSPPVHQLRSRGRCYRCGQRGHYRLHCVNPRRPRQRVTPLETELFQDDEQRRFWYDSTTSGDETTGPPIVGGPADGGSRTAAFVLDHQQHATHRVRRRPTTNAMTTDSMQTGKVLVGAADRLSTARSLNRMATGVRATNGLRQHESERQFVRAIENGERGTARRAQTSAVINRPDYPLIGGPADGSIGRFNRSCRWR